MWVRGLSDLKPASLLIVTSQVLAWTWSWGARWQDLCLRVSQMIAMFTWYCPTFKYEVCIISKVKRGPTQSGQAVTCSNWKLAKPHLTLNEDPLLLLVFTLTMNGLKFWANLRFWNHECICTVLNYRIILKCSWSALEALLKHSCEPACPCSWCKPVLFTSPWGAPVLLPSSLRMLSW